MKYTLGDYNEESLYKKHLQIGALERKIKFIM